MPTQVQPRGRLSGGGCGLSNQITKGAARYVLFVFIATFKLDWLKRVEIEDAKTTGNDPLAIERVHHSEGDQERHTRDDETSAEVIENCGSRSATQALAYGPFMQFDDVVSKRAI